MGTGRLLSLLKVSMLGSSVVLVAAVLFVHLADRTFVMTVSTFGYALLALVSMTASLVAHLVAERSNSLGRCGV